MECCVIAPPPSTHIYTRPRYEPCLGTGERLPLTDHRLSLVSTRGAHLYIINISTLYILNEKLVFSCLHTKIFNEYAYTVTSIGYIYYQTVAGWKVRQALPYMIPVMSLGGRRLTHSP